MRFASSRLFKENLSSEHLRAVEMGDALAFALWADSPPVGRHAEPLGGAAASQDAYAEARRQMLREIAAMVRETAAETGVGRLDARVMAGAHTLTAGG